MARNIIITGCTSGIGKELSLSLSNVDDINLFLIGRSKEKLDSLNLPLAKTFCVDLQDSDALDETLGLILSENEIDVLINNAGVGLPTNLSSPDVVEKYDSIFDTNVKAVVQITAPVLAQMKTANSGLIINISSEAGLSSNPVAPIYCASKFALEAYSDGLRQQLKQEKLNIRVSVIRPAAIDTNYWGERDVPRGEFLQAKEVVDTILFVLNSPESVTIKSIDLESARF